MARQGDYEIGTAYVAVMPSMGEFNTAIRKALKEQIGYAKEQFKELSKAAAEIGKAVRQETAKEFKDLSKTTADLGKAMRVEVSALNREFSKYSRTAVDVYSKLSKATGDYKGGLAAIFSEGIADGADQSLKQIDGWRQSVLQTLNSDGSMREALKNFVVGSSGGEDIGAALAGGIKGAAPAMQAAGLNLVKQMADMVIEKTNEVMEETVSIFTEAGKRAGLALVDGVRAAYGTVVGLMTNIADTYASTIASATQRAYSSVGSMMQNVGQQQVSAAASALGLDFGQSVADGFNTMQFAMGNAMGDLISNVANTVSGKMGDAIQRLDTVKNFPRVMANMGVDTTDSENSINALVDAIDGLPTALDDVVLFTQKIFPNFNGDLDAATESAIAFNNAVVASGASFEKQQNAMEQWSQMFANQKVDMLSWRSVVEAMPSQINQLASYFGADSPTALYNMLPGSKGALDNGVQVTFNELNEALVRLNEEGLGPYASYAEQAKVATAGIGTAIVNVSNRIEKALDEVMDYFGQTQISSAINDFSRGFIPAAKQFNEFLDSVGTKDFLSNTITTLKDGFAALGPALQPVVDKLAPLVSGVYDAALTTLSATIDHIVEKAGPFLDFVGNKLQSVIDNLPAISERLQPIINAFVDFKIDTFQAAIDMWERLANAIAPVLPEIITHVSETAQTISQFVGDIAPDLATLATNFTGTISSMLADLEPTVTSIVHALTPVVSTMALQIGDAIVRVAELIDGVVNMAKDEDLTVLQYLVERVGQTFNTLFDVLMQPMGGENGVPLIDSLAQTFASFADTILTFIGNISGVVGPVFANISAIIAGVLEDLRPTIESVITTLAPVVEVMVGQIAEMARSIAPIIEQVMGLTTDDGAPLLMHVVQVIGDTIQSIIDVLAPHIPHFVEAISKIVDALAPAIERVFQMIEPYIDDIIDLFVYAATEFATALIDVFQNYIIPEMPTLLQFARDVIDFLTDHFGEIVRQVITVIEGLGPVWLNIQRLKDDWIPAILNVASFVCTFLINPFIKLAHILSDALDKLPRVNFEDLLPTDFRNVFGIAEQVQMAKGGIAYGPTNALIAEAGTPEAVVPLSAQGIQRFTSGLSLDTVGGPRVEVHIDRFANYDTSTDIDTLTDTIGRDSLRKLKMRGVGA